jgi:phosphatidylserine/phosphatidylglycerophosphate/cardiolipin synthase-like enzyme
VRVADWFLTAAERGNPATGLDARRGGMAWSAGNEVRPLIHGAAYFAELLARVPALRAGDLLLFTDWRGDAGELLAPAGPAIADLFGAAARRGVMVRGLLWRSHLDRFQFSQQENRRLGEEVEAAGGECLLDMRVRPGGSHHMKMVVLRHAGRPADDVAFVGGIDLCHSRRDDACHAGDLQRQPMAAVYGERPPWHDVQAMIQGPAVGDVEAVFRERWEDPAPPTRNPLRRLRDAPAGVDDARRLPPQPPDPPARGTHAVQLLRTYPYRRRGYVFAPEGERSIARGYLKTLPRARSLIYLEDQYRTTSTGGPGRTTPSSAAPSSTSQVRWSVRGRAATRMRCAPRSAASISVVAPTVSWTAPAAPSRRSAGPPPAWTPGTRAGGEAPGRPAGCAATARLPCRPGPGRGRSCPTG